MTKVTGKKEEVVEVVEEVVVDKTKTEVVQKEGGIIFDKDDPDNSQLNEKVQIEPKK